MNAMKDWQKALGPSAQQLVDYTDGRVLPPLQQAIFWPGKRGRPRPGAGKVVVSSMEEVKNFLTTGPWWNYVPAPGRRPVVELQFKNTAAIYEATIEVPKDHEKIYLVVPEKFLVCAAVPRERKAIPVGSQPKALKPPPPPPPPPPPAPTRPGVAFALAILKKAGRPLPAGSFYACRQATKGRSRKANVKELLAWMCQQGLLNRTKRVIRNRSVTCYELVSVVRVDPVPATPAVMKQYDEASGLDITAYGEVLTALRFLKAENPRPLIAQLLDIRQTEAELVRGNIQTRNDTLAIAVSARQQAEAWAKGAASLTEDSLRVLAALERELKQ